MIIKHIERCHDCKAKFDRIKAIMTSKAKKFDELLIDPETIQNIENDPECQKLFGEIIHHAVEEVKEFDKTLSYHKKT
jgi:hypothetical protein